LERLLRQRLAENNIVVLTMRELHDFLYPERFIAGTVGMPGERTFYLQAVEGRRNISVALEKTQLDLLAQRIIALFKELKMGRAGDLKRKSNILPQLLTPFNEEFRVTALSLTWNAQNEQLIIEAQGGEESEVIEDGEEGPPLLRVTLTMESALHFALDSFTLIGAGRPPCQFCGGPLDAQGHVCPRANGYRR
jgi:uncharacterized repeat protein (TIGR03847 family)